jgi:sterol desaturase/sphingolipid hydroxylase (fatty acid hydroxylase superfamily)
MEERLLIDEAGNVSSPKAPTSLVALFAVLASCAIFVVSAMLLMPSFGEWLNHAVSALQSPIVEVCERIAPVAPERLCGLAVNTYLAVWLYVVVAIVFIGEKIWPAALGQPVVGLGTRQDFLFWFGVNGVLKAVAGMTVLVCVGWLYENYLSAMSINFTEDWSQTRRVIVGFIVADFLNWFHHWLRHKVPVFWNFHAVHHSQTEMNLFTDYRIHFVEYLIAKPIVLIPLLMLNLPVEYAILIVVLQRCYTLIYHANLRTDYGMLRYVLVTPQSHRIHHSRLGQHADKNFGVIFCIWDRIFGTHCSDDHEYPPTGIDDPEFPMEEKFGLVSSMTSYVRQIVYPFKQLFRRDPVQN